ncbi:MAG: pyridoxal phosphate-dependent aminotransferase [Bacteroidales bacterium]|jgi:aspartate/methionine/tyrosine aminotransferase|nr:pyridoxal phosphate-dependent aminotransferase [Bacteroidales bacterium]
MSKNILPDRQTVKRTIDRSGIKSVSTASIRELVKLVNDLESATGCRYVRMEMGVPGLPAVSTGVEAEIKALGAGVASVYPDIEGLPALKTETSKFIKLFLDLDINPQGCIPTVGSTMGSMAAFLVANQCTPGRSGTLFIDPGFPVQKMQIQMLGHDCYSFDLFNYRGEKLKNKLESVLSTGKVSSVIYSNPNNPTWMCLTEKELSTIGEVCTKYDTVVIEDLAYFAMDFRTDYSQPGHPPYQPTAGKFTNNYVLLISSSKAFSYAGQRLGMIAVSDKLYNRDYPGLLKYYSAGRFGHAIVFGALYGLSAGAPHSAQHGLCAILKAVNDGNYNFLATVREYGEKAGIMKAAFINNGFTIAYDTDIDRPVADGFYFTIAYPGMKSGELLEKLLYHGVSAITLDITGSSRDDSLRACVSHVFREQFGDLEARLQQFRVGNPV